MDMLAHCRAMAAFCRQRAKFEDENSLFWISEADEWDRLISEYARHTAPTAASRIEDSGWLMRSLGK